MHAGRVILLVLLVAGAARADLLDDLARADADADDRVHDLLVHGLLADAAALRADVETLGALDDQRREAGLARTGLTDDARYLAAALPATRDGRRTALKGLLARHTDPMIRHLAEHRLEADDATAADQLLTDDRHNRRASLLNDAVRPLGVFSGTTFLAALNPFMLAGSAIDSVASTATNLWHYNRLTAEEREALVRYRTVLERDPGTADAPEIAHAIRRLGEKRERALCKQTVDLGETALAHDDLEAARFYLVSARHLDGCAARVTAPLERLARAHARRDAAEDAARWPVDDPPEPATEDERRDHEALVRAVAGGDPGHMIEVAGRFIERHRDSALAPGARFTVAVARDLAGHPEAARDALADLAGDTHSSAGRHAAAVLASAEFNPLGALDAAERRHARSRLRYIFLGSRPGGRTALYTAAHVGAEGVQAAESFGLFNVIGLATRALSAWRHDPVSNQDIIDRGEDFLARTPTGPESAWVHARLGAAYEREGNYARALMHCREAPDPDPDEIARLEGKIADRLLADAEQSGDALRLQTVVRYFGGTKAAHKAEERLRARDDPGETTLAREVLEKSPTLVGPSGLDLDATLLDGERSNGELADGGLTLDGNLLKLRLKNEATSGERIETRTLDPAAAARARAAAAEALYAHALTAPPPHPESGRFERYLPFFVQGSIGEDGVAISPGLKLRAHQQTKEPTLYE